MKDTKCMRSIFNLVEKPPFTKLLKMAKKQKISGSPSVCRRYRRIFEQPIVMKKDMRGKGVGKRGEKEMTEKLKKELGYHLDVG
jgi:hypothetical protein